MTDIRAEAQKHIAIIEHWVRADRGPRGDELRAAASFIADMLERCESAVESTQVVPADLGNLTFAPDHNGMRVDYRGLLRHAQSGLRREPSLAEMLRQLTEHLTELGDRFYAGEVTAVDEFLQLYCVARERRVAALAAEPVRPQPDELRDMEARKDAAYLERNQVVAALAKCFPSGVARTAIEGWSEDWHGCVYIDLPTGQASWHFHDSHAYLFEGLPAYTGLWDCHDTPEKYRRLAAIAVKPPAQGGET